MLTRAPHPPVGRPFAGRLARACPDAGVRVAMIAIGCVAALLLSGAGASAHTYDPAAPPAENFPATWALPQACVNLIRHTDRGTVAAADRAACARAGVATLDEARARLHQPPYALPSDFLSLTQTEQAFVLTDLDRVLYGLAPITGTTGQMAQLAQVGVRRDEDPLAGSALPGNLLGFTSNWAAGYPDMIWAYEGWMYADGIGSGNLDCTAARRTGCWGHRFDILTTEFTAGTPTVAGAAAGTDPSGVDGYTMILAELAHGGRVSYSYTWADAVAHGANDGAYGHRTGRRRVARG